MLTAKFSLLGLPLVLLTAILAVCYGQLEDELCNAGHLIVTEDTTNSIRVTVKSTLADAQQETMFIGSSLPAECGKQYIRCNLTILKDYDTERIVVVVPLTREVGLILYNSSMHYLEHIVLQSTSNFNCQLITFFKVSRRVLARNQLLGLCLNTSREEQVNLRITVLSILFTNLTLSTLSVGKYEMTTTALSFPADISQTLYFQEPAACFETDNQSLFFIDGTALIVLNTVNGLVEYFEMFDKRNQSNPTLVDCVHPRELVRVANNILVAYCENVTIEVDVCELRTTTILVNTYYYDGEGMQFYCSDDGTTFLNVKDGIMTTVKTEHDSTRLFSNHSVRLPADINAIHSANCLISDSRDIHVVLTAGNGKTYVMYLSEGLSVTIETSSQKNSVPHSLFLNQLVLMNNRGQSQLFNLSRLCPGYILLVLEVDHLYHLSAYIPNDEATYSCICNESSSYTTSTIPMYEPSTSELTSDLSTEIIASSPTYTVSTATTNFEPINQSSGSPTQPDLYIELVVGLVFLGGLLYALHDCV